MHTFLARLSGALVALLLLPPALDEARTPQASVLDRHLLVTWYGNPHSAQMGILGELNGAARATGLRRQAREYSALTGKTVLMAYHLVAVVAQCTAGNDGKWRRRESAPVIRALLDEARANGFKLILDIQPGRSTVTEEAEALRPFLAEPDVYVALDPEFVMSGCEVPGQHIGQLPAKDLNGVSWCISSGACDRASPSISALAPRSAAPRPARG